MCLSWGKIFRRARLSRPKIFLSADHPWSRKQLSILSRQTAGEFQRHLTFHPRQTAGELQVSLFAFTVKSPKIPVPPLPAGKTPFALLELPGSPLPGCLRSLRRKFYLGISAPARSPLAPPACIQIFPHPSATRGGSFMAPPLAKVGQKFCFMLPPPASPLSG